MECQVKFLNEEYSFCPLCDNKVFISSEYDLETNHPARKFIHDKIWIDIKIHDPLDMNGCIMHHYQQECVKDSLGIVQHLYQLSKEYSSFKICISFESHYMHLFKQDVNNIMSKKDLGNQSIDDAIIWFWAHEYEVANIESMSTDELAELMISGMDNMTIEHVWSMLEHFDAEGLADFLKDIDKFYKEAKDGEK
jgi:hypothetical protein